MNVFQVSENCQISSKAFVLDRRDPLNYVTWLSAEYKLYNDKYCEERVRWKWKEFEEET